MIAVGITQRCLPPTEFGELRDGLDRRWSGFLAACGLVPVPLPNSVEHAVDFADALRLGGIVLTGGENLVAYGGSCPERDETERALLAWAMGAGVPVLGVCRGAQLLLDRFGARLVEVDGHVATRHSISGDGGLSRTVNSYHRLAARSVPESLRATATSSEVVEAFQHRRAAVAGIMWHPEREDSPMAEDLDLFREWFGGGECVG